jgi:hypothetical protein
MTFPCRTLAILSMLLLLLVTPATTAATKRQAPTRQVPSRVTLSKSDISLSPGQYAELNATVVDKDDNEITSANVEWTVAPNSPSLELSTVGKNGTKVILHALETAIGTNRVTLSAKSGRATALLTVQVQTPSPADIIFLNAVPVELPINGKETIRVNVLDTNGNRIPNAQVKWQLADPSQNIFVYPGTITNNQTTNSIEILWLPGVPKAKPPATVLLIASADGVVKTVAVKYLRYEKVAKEIVFEPKELQIGPGDLKTVKATVRTSDATHRVLDEEVTAELSSSADNVIKILDVTKNEIKLIGLYSNTSDFNVQTALLVKAEGAANTMPVIYARNPVKTTWDIIPPNICGDNFGRTIKNDYYCINVSIENNSGSKLALAGLEFQPACNVSPCQPKPPMSYGIVHGSMTKRKLTHPRAMTLAIIDGVGTLMTGFNPFFHDLNHKANYSTFIDIVSNPLAKGLAMGWKDPYPDELANFEANVLKDDKILSDSDTPFKTTIFYPKRLLKKKVKDPDDLDVVRQMLGSLVVYAFKIEPGASREVSRTP